MHLCRLSSLSARNAGHGTQGLATGAHMTCPPLTSPALHFGLSFIRYEDAAPALSGAHFPCPSLASVLCQSVVQRGPGRWPPVSLPRRILCVYLQGYCGHSKACSCHPTGFLVSVSGDLCSCPPRVLPCAWAAVVLRRLASLPLPVCVRSGCLTRVCFRDGGSLSLASGCRTP